MLKSRTGTSATGTGVANAPEFTPMELDSFDGMNDTDIQGDILDAEYLPADEVVAFDHRVEECFSGDCTLESLCLDCLTQISVAA